MLSLDSLGGDEESTGLDSTKDCPIKLAAPEEVESVLEGALARRVLRERERLSAVERLLLDIGSQVGVLAEDARVDWDESDA